MNIMIGVAGHIDHGKTELVKMLTGCDTDRLKEEKERGMSIDIGYAPCFLGNSRVGIVDVPGHERFIRNMVAGATGIDIALIVIAADDGVMPQTREHLDIIELLGIRHALAAITKIDLVSSERVDQVSAEVHEFFDLSAFRDVSITPVSSVTGDGLDILRQRMQEKIESVGPRKTGGVFRMPVGRVFSSHGHGVVATGVSVSGQVKIGDMVEILPIKKLARVRGVQVFLGDTDEGIAGQCVALNLANTHQDDLARGSVIAAPGRFSAHTSFTVQLKTSLFLNRPIRNSSRIRFHTGTSETSGKIRLLEADEANAGEETFAQVFLDQPVAAFLRDRFILRLETPPSTAAGGTILECGAWRYKRRHPPTFEKLQKRWESCNSDSRFLADRMTDDLYTLRTISELALLTGQKTEEAETTVKTLMEEGVIIRIGEKFLLKSAFNNACQNTFMTLNQLHRTYPDRYTFTAKEIRMEMKEGAELAELTLTKLAEQKRIMIHSGSYRSPEAEDADPRTSALANQLEAILFEERYQTSSPEQLADRVRKPEKEVEIALRYLTEKERVRRLAEKVYLHDKHVQWAKEQLVTSIRRDGFFETHKFKDIIGSSRKYAIPLLDYFDAIGLTRRMGGNRYLCNK
jgi:selenocysteine-specific elongation factor